MRACRLECIHLFFALWHAESDSGAAGRLPGQSAMAAEFREQRSLLGLEVFIPAVAGVQCEWHAGRLMSRLADADVMEATTDSMQKGRKRLEKHLKSCKDAHMLLWPGNPVTLRPAISNAKGRKDA